MDSNFRPSGIEGLGDMSWGTHFCLFYETKEDLLDFFIPFFKAGLEHHEFCLCVASEPLIAEEAEQAMRQAFPDFERYQAEGQIEITVHTDWYLKEGHFEEGGVLQGWRDKLDQALAKGFSGIRFAANILLEGHDWESFARYEGKLDETLHGLRIEGLCAYNLNRYSAAKMLDVIRHHQFTLARRDGTWESLEGFNLKRAHEEVLKLNVELDGRVKERTAQLEAANEQLTREVAEREEAEARLHSQEQEYRTIVENAPDQIIRYDRNLRRVYVNPAVTKDYALSKEAFIGKPIGSIVTDARLEVDAEEVEAQRRRIQAVFDTGEPIETEVTWPVPAGRRTFSSRLFPEFDPNGEVISVLGIARDITERKRAEEAIRKSEQVLREAESLGHTGSWEQNLVTGEIFNTEENLRLFFGDDHSKGADFEDYAEAVHPDDREYVMQRRVQLLSERGPSDIEYRVVWPDGSVHVIFGRATVVYDELGQALRVYGTNVDITERKQAEEALRESEEKFSAAFRASPIALVIATVDGKYVEMNQAFCELLGYSREELLGKTAVDIGIFNAETRREWLEVIERAGGVMTNVEFNFRLRNGISRTTLFSVETIAFHGVPHRLTTVLDITERKRMEEALRISENNFRTLADKSLHGIAIYQRSNIVYVNPAHCAIIGYTIEEFQSMSVEQVIALVHPLDRSVAEERARKRLAGEELSPSVELRVVRKDGSTRWLQSFNNPIEYNGQPALLSTSIDITERKQAEEALRQSESNFRTLAEKSLEGIQLYQGGRSVYANAAMTALMGYTQEEFKAMSMEEHIALVHPLDRATAVERARKRQAGQEVPVSLEVRVLTKAGATRWVQGFTNEIEYNGQPAILSTAIDITERKQAEQDIRGYAARMEALAEISRTFVEVGLDYQRVLNTVVRRTAELIGDACVMTLFSDDGQRSYPVAFYHRDPKALDMMQDALLHTWQGGTDTQRYQTLLAGNAIYIPVVNPEEFRASLEPEFGDFFDTIGISSVLIVPLQVQGRVIGTLGLTRDRQGSSYTGDDQVLLQDLADRAALIIQNAQLFRQVQGARERLEALSRRLLEVQEAERRTLTSELHDRVGQNLTGLSINLQNMKALLSNELAKTLAAKFDDAQALVEHTTRQIRDIMAELHPPELEDYGLAVALETYAERAASRGNLKLIADLPDLAPPPLPSDVLIALFRAAQEAISNVLKHANAIHLEISLEEHDGGVRLMIEDDGQGFEPDAASQKEAQTWGLKLMRERIESIGGKVQVESEPGGGTRVTFEVERQS